MKIRELLSYTKEDMERAKLCSDEIVNVLNKYDLKPLLVKSTLSLIESEADDEINRLIKENQVNIDEGV